MRTVIKKIYGFILITSAVFLVIAGLDILYSSKPHWGFFYPVIIAFAIVYGGGVIIVLISRFRGRNSKNT